MRHTLIAFILPAGLVAGAAWAADPDAEFVEKAARGGLMEVELGRHASQHAESASVRSFGQRMVTDHGTANAELAAAAKRQGLTVPTALDQEHRDKIAKLTARHGADFDEAYMEEMVDDHEHDIDQFREQAEEAKSDVDRFAAKALPTLEAHLAQARTIEEALDASEDAGEMP